MRGDNALWTVVNAPFSRFTEAIRSIKLAADLNGVVKSQPGHWPHFVSAKRRQIDGCSCARAADVAGERTDNFD